MTRLKVSDKLSAAFSVLLDKGPLSISSLAEEVTKVVGGKVSTTRSQLSVVLPELLKFGIVEEVGTDRFGSRLIDITPKSVAILLLLYASGFRFKYLPWRQLIRYFERRHPELTTRLKLLMCITEAWKIKEFGAPTEEDHADILEELTYAIRLLGKRYEVRDMESELLDISLTALRFCLRAKCEVQMLECVRKEKLAHILYDTLRKVDIEDKKVSEILTIIEQK